MKPVYSSFALAGMLLISTAAEFDAPHWTVLEQNTRTVEWARVNRFTVPQGSARTVRITGPWMDYITSVTPIAGITGYSIQHPEGKTTLILHADQSTSRGDHTVQVKIGCPPLSNLIGCAPAAVIPVKVLEMGPITGVTPNGTVAPNTTMNFTLTGEGMNVATILGRLTSLQNASILSGATSSSITVRGTTKSCGYVTIALSDVVDGDEFPYKNLASPIVAGSVCAGSGPNTPPTYVYCPVGQTYDANTKTCH